MKKYFGNFILVLVAVSFVTLNGQEIRGGSWRVTLNDPGFTLNSGNGDRIMQKEIKFSPPLESKPNVIVSVSFVDAEKDQNIRYDVKAMGASRDGFTIRIKTWDNTKIFGIGGSWFAVAEKLKIEEEKIEVGQTIRLNNIFFEFNKSELLPDSFEELDRVYTFLNDNPTVEIELGGHTDNVGSDEYNKSLSQKRAESVKNYLVGKGIDAAKLVAKGYGETKPIETNDEDWGREKNRRVEFTILRK
ncbi:MAG: OmpA family protein [Ignavibacteria bacterium]